MKTIQTLLGLGLLFSAPLSAAPVSYQGHTFEATVVRENGQRYREFNEKGQATLKVRPGEEFSIVLRNPLPVRAAVALSVDGLNTVDGKRSSPRNARKWILEPYGSMTVSGWQTSSESARKFVFVQDEASFANWREKKEGKPYGRNLGVIGAAWFWNAEELERALHPPQPFEDDVIAHNKASKRADSNGAPAPAAAEASGRAGTGMGREQSNPVTQVAFNATAGMYSVRDVLKIFYEFAQEPAVPQPFISDDDDSGRFTPQM
jgi:hypothetical protein